MRVSPRCPQLKRLDVFVGRRRFLIQRFTLALDEGHDLTRASLFGLS